MKLAHFLVALTAAVRHESAPKTAMENSLHATVNTSTLNPNAGKCAVVAATIDRSGSMQTELNWLPQAIEDIMVGLEVKGFVAGKNVFCLSQFVNYGVETKIVPGYNCAYYTTGGSLQSAFGLVANNGFEDGNLGLEVVLDAADGFIANTAGLFTDCFTGIVKTSILISDEDRNVEVAGTPDKAATLARLDADSWVHNNVLNIKQFDVNGETNVVLGVNKAEGNGYSKASGPNFSKFSGKTITITPCDTDSGTQPAGFRCSETLDDYFEFSEGAPGRRGFFWDLNVLRNGNDDAAAFSKAFVDGKVAELSQRPPCDTPTCGSGQDPHVQTLQGMKYSFSGAGEHLMTQWGANKITTCLFQTEHRDHSFQRSASFTCHKTTLISQASKESKYHERKLRYHFVDSETQELLQDDSIGDFSTCDLWLREATCTCDRGSAVVSLNVKTMRHNGVNYLDLKISPTWKHQAAKSLAEVSTLHSGLCQSETQPFGSFLSGDAKCNTKAAATGISYPHNVFLQQTRARGTRRANGAMFHGKCGPKSWKVENGPVTLLAEKHPSLFDGCKNVRHYTDAF